MGTLSERTLAIAESATQVIDARAKSLIAQGQDVIGFGAGEPDFTTPDYIVAAAVEACQRPQLHKYTPVAGLPELRAAIASVSKPDLPHAVDASQVLVTNGAKQALFNALAGIINPGDEVIIPAPYWVTYPEVVTWLGGVPVAVMGDEANGFKVTPGQLQAATTAKTKAIVFASPSNPTGAVYGADELTAIGQWALENNLWVISDDIYRNFVYDGAEFHSIGSLVPEIADHYVAVNAVSKSYAMTGWRLGWMIGPLELIKAATRLQSHSTSNVSNVAQAAALAALQGDAASVVAMRDEFDHRRRLAVDMLSQTPGISCVEPLGAFYVFPSIKDLLGKTVHGHRIDSSLGFGEVVLEEIGIAVVPGEAFGAPGYFRLSYALSEDKLKEGLARLTNLLG